MTHHRTQSSRRWLKEHFSDPFVKQAQKEGYRSRAVFKLIEIQKKDTLIKAGMIVVDLGAAPGGWSQLLQKWAGERGKVIALDILKMAPLPAVEFIQGDFREPAVIEKLIQTLQQTAKAGKADAVVSDMAPNASGLTSVDQSRAMLLAELSFALAKKILRPDGNFLVKAFQGEEYDAFLKNLRRSFKKVEIRKPEASRARSRENYLMGKGFVI